MHLCNASSSIKYASMQVSFPDASPVHSGDGADPSSPTKAAADLPNDEDDPDAKRFNLNGYTNHLPPVDLLQDDFEQLTTSTEKDDSSYDLSGGKQLALVFNHAEFQYNDHPKRNGTKSDCEAILQTFGKKLGFDVRFYNLTTQICDVMVLTRTFFLPGPNLRRLPIRQDHVRHPNPPDERRYPLLPGLVHSDARRRKWDSAFLRQTLPIRQEHRE